MIRTRTTGELSISSYPSILFHSIHLLHFIHLFHSIHLFYSILFIYSTNSIHLFHSIHLIYFILFYPILFYSLPLSLYIYTYIFISLYLSFYSSLYIFPLSSQYQRLNTQIHIPLDGVDLAPFVLGENPSNYNNNKDNNNKNNNDNKKKKKTEEEEEEEETEEEEERRRGRGELLYQVFAVVNHIGGSRNFGHYTCNARRWGLNGEWMDGREKVGQWYNYDDTSVTPISPQEVITSQGIHLLLYLFYLFYLFYLYYLYYLSNLFLPILYIRLYS